MSLRVFTPGESAWARGMLHDAADAAERRLRPIALPETLDAWRRMRPRVLRKLNDVLGLAPSETCDLDPQVVGVTRRRGYRVERIVLQTRPGCPLPVNLYVPMRADLPAPAVLCPHGHAPDGKAHPEYQRYFINLARRGYVVLSFDMIGYNERDGMGHRNVFTPFLHGGSTIGMILWDGIKALDYLCSRPEVDRARIGCTGNSGGGKQTLLLSALDERIAVSAPAGHNATYAYTSAKERHICACNMLPGLLTFAEMDWVYALIAPRPLLMVMGRDDRLFPFDLAQRVFRRTRRVYRLFDVEDRVGLTMCACGHPYDQPKREAMYAWFDRFLMGRKATSVHEADVRVEGPESGALTCFPDGALPQAAASADQLALRDGRAVLAQTQKRLAQRNGRERARRLLRKVLWPAGRPRSRPTVESRGAVSAAPGSPEKLLVRPDSSVALPCLVYSGGDAVREVTILVDEKGKGCRRAVRASRDLAGRGRAVLAADLRGWGECRAGELSEDGELDEHVAAQRGLMYGSPIMGQRVADVSALVDYVRHRWPGRKIGLCGVGLGALVACLAVAVGGGPDFLVLRRLPKTLLVAGKPLSFCVPGVLRVGDVSDLLALVAPTPVRIE